MKVLVIPDVHLKPEIFDRAMDIMENADCERAVCVGDICDDWGCEDNVALYKETLQKALEFARKYPNTLWCYGNHDLAYLWDRYEHPGFSEKAQDTVCEYFNMLDEEVSLAVMHRIDNVIFSHAGLTKEFVDDYLNDIRDDVDAMIDAVNCFGDGELWDDTSPIWARPQKGFRMGSVYLTEFLQVVGHTPMRSIDQTENLLTTDVFSTWSDGRKFGEEEFCWVDTVTKEWGYID
ncbi:MAG: metallophosphoesterase [Clostridiales bacterium]|nr:metallophosphoesterase [Clostridiales bacterium]